MSDATGWETFDQVGFGLAWILLGVLWQSSILFAAAYRRLVRTKPMECYVLLNATIRGKT